MGGRLAIHCPAGPPQRAVKEGWAGEAVEPGSSLQELAEEGSQREARPEVVVQAASHGMAREEGGCWKHSAG